MQHTVTPPRRAPRSTAPSPAVLPPSTYAYEMETHRILFEYDRIGNAWWDDDPEGMRCWSPRLLHKALSRKYVRPLQPGLPLSNPDHPETTGATTAQ